MKISQLRGLLGQLQLRHGDLDVRIVANGVALGTDGARGQWAVNDKGERIYLMLPRSTERSPGEGREHEHSNDQ